jgi:hypothetical protein
VSLSFWRWGCHEQRDAKSRPPRALSTRSPWWAQYPQWVPVTVNGAGPCSLIDTEITGVLLPYPYQDSRAGLITRADLLSPTGDSRRTMNAHRARITHAGAYQMTEVVATVAGTRRP